MGLNAKKAAGGSDRVAQEVLEPGVYPARLVQLIDLGVQPQRPFQGKDKPPAQEIMITYEFTDEFMKDEDGNEIEDKPRWYSETFPLFNLKAERAKSTQRYNALDPEGLCGGDFTALAGIPCNVTLVHNVKDGTVYANVANVGAMRPRDAAKCPELVNKSKVFDLDAPDISLFSSLPEWVQEKIRNNLGFKGSKLEGLLDEGAAKSKDDKLHRCPDDEDVPY